MSENIMTELRRGARILAAAIATGALLGALAAAMRPTNYVSSAELLLSARSLDPEGLRRRPMSVEELRTHLNDDLLNAAEKDAGLVGGVLRARVSVSARSQSGIYDIEVAQDSQDDAQRAATAVRAQLVSHLNELRERRVAAQLKGSLGQGKAQTAREFAEAAYLANLTTGQLEEAEIAAARGGDAHAATVLAKARAEREQLRLRLERAQERENVEEEIGLRGRAAAYAFEPFAEALSEPGPAKARDRNVQRGALVGGSLGLLLSGTVLFLFGWPVRRKSDGAAPTSTDGASGAA